MPARAREEIEKAFFELLKTKKPEPDGKTIVITVADLYELTSRSPMTIQMYLRNICQRFGKYVNGKCVILHEETSETNT